MAAENKSSSPLNVFPYSRYRYSDSLELYTKVSQFKTFSILFLKAFSLFFLSQFRDWKGVKSLQKGVY